MTLTESVGLSKSAVTTIQLAFAIIELVLVAVFVVLAWQAYVTYSGYTGQFNGMSCLSDLSTCIGLTSRIVVELFLVAILMFIVALVAIRAPTKVH